MYSILQEVEQVYNMVYCLWGSDKKFICNIVKVSKKLIVFYLSVACPLCSRLGLQADINKTLLDLKEAQANADIVSNLKDLWPELTKVEGLIDDAEVCFYTVSLWYQQNDLKSRRVANRHLIERIRQTNSAKIDRKRKICLGLFGVTISRAIVYNLFTGYTLFWTASVLYVME